MSDLPASMARAASLKPGATIASNGVSTMAWAVASSTVRFTPRVAPKALTGSQSKARW